MKGSKLKVFMDSIFSHDPEDGGYLSRYLAKKEPEEYPHTIPNGIEDWMWKYLKDTNAVVNDEKRSYTFWDGTKIQHHILRPYIIKDGDKIFYTPRKVDINDGYTEITIRPVPEFETKHELTMCRGSQTYIITINGGWFFDYFCKIQSKVRAGHLKGNDESVYEKSKVKDKYTRQFYKKAGLTEEDIDIIEYNFWNIYILETKKILEILNVYPELYDPDNCDWWVKYTAAKKYPEKTYTYLNSVMMEDQIKHCIANGAARFSDGVRYESKVFMELCLKHSLYDTVTHAKDYLTEELLDFFIEEDVDNVICNAADLLNEAQKDRCIKESPKRAVERFNTLTEEQLDYCVRMVPATTLAWEKHKSWILTKEHLEYCVSECPATVLLYSEKFSPEQLKICVFLAPQAAMELYHLYRGVIDNEGFINHCIDKCPLHLLRYSYRFSKVTQEHLDACRVNITSKGEE